MSSEEFTARPLRAWHLALWFVAATASTMCGIGGGLFAVPILHFLLGLPLKLSTATSLVAVFVMTLAGTATELLSPGNAIQWPVVVLLCLGGMIGAAVGQRVATRINARTLTWIFAVALCAGGVRILTSSQGSGPEAVNASVVLDAASALWIIAAGFAGGFVAPLLGVGGGLIVVPALFLGVSGMSYLAARACSTAMSVANSAQLTWLNLRADRVHRASILPFALVAVLGAVLGIALVHQPAWSHAARVLMGVLMLAISAKFAWRGWRVP